jgi:hypothetical protein
VDRAHARHGVRHAAGDCRRPAPGRGPGDPCRRGRRHPRRPRRLRHRPPSRPRCARRRGPPAPSPGQAAGAPRAVGGGGGARAPRAPWPARIAGRRRPRLPAGLRHRLPVRQPGRLQPAHHEPRARPQRARPCVPHGAVASGAGAHRVPDRLPVGRRRGPDALQAQRPRPHHGSLVAARAHAARGRSASRGRAAAGPAAPGDPGRPGGARSARRARAARRAAGRADRQGLAGQGLRARRQPVRDRRDRRARHPPDAGRDGGLRRARDRRQLDALHRVPAPARAGGVRPDRRPRRAHRAALPGGRRPGRGRPGHAGGAAAAPGGQRRPRLPRAGPARDSRLVGADRAAGHPHPRPR